MGTIPRLGALLLLLAFPWAGGCLAPETTECREASCEASPPLLPDGGDAAIVWQDCVGGVGSLQVDYQAARAAVPGAFRLDGTSPVTASALLQVLRCDRVVVNATIFRDVSFLKTILFVFPAEPAWALDGTHYYVVDALVSEPELVPLLARGMPIAHAVFSTDRTDLAGGLSVTHWTVAARTCELALSFGHLDEEDSPSSGVFHHWSGRGPFTRLEAQQNYQYNPHAGAEAARFEGECATSRLTGSTVPVRTRAYDSFDSRWTIPTAEYE